MTFLRNVWSDLMEKRLWPIALLLLLLLIAVPVLLASGGSGSPDAPLATPPATARAATDTAIVALDVTPAAKAALHRGRGRDPFNQPKLKSAAATGLTATVAGATATTGPSGSSGGAATPTPKPVVKVATYKVDLRFGQAGDMRIHSDVARLTPLPSSTNPFFVLLGVKDGGRTVVFLISSDAAATGDGRCRPKATQCETIEMRDGDTEFFDVTTDTGEVEQYQMDVLSIHKLLVTPAAAKAANARTSRAGAAILSTAKVRGDHRRTFHGYLWKPTIGVLVPLPKPHAAAKVHQQAVVEGLSVTAGP